jgi:excinuclease ABC subunit A
MSRPREILITGARVHNLKNVTLAIPRNQLVVFTGVSGSGKSSLAFDTLYAEGQRRYVESLSSYARQFLARMDKPDVDYIEGLSPAIAIEQKTISSNPRSTVGTVTEIFDYLKLLFARAGRTFSPISGKEVKADSISDVVDFILTLKQDSRVFIYIQQEAGPKLLRRKLEVALQKGFTRIIGPEGELLTIEDLISENKLPISSPFFLLIDRLVIREEDEDLASRLADSVQTAFLEGEGYCLVESGGTEYEFSDKFEADGMAFERPSPPMFAFNNPYGACKTCQGFGRIVGIDEELVIPDKSKSVYDGAIAPWRGDTMGNYLKRFIREAYDLDFPIHKPYFSLSEQNRKILWKGAPGVHGLDHFFKDLESQLHKIQYRVMLSRFRGFTKCPDCEGSRIRPDTAYVKLHGYSIQDWLDLPISELTPILDAISFTDYEQKVAGRVIREITSRLKFLLQVGLGYLSLNRPSSTLSGGESQRINLATSLGSSLVGSLYILDEPSVGLHPRDADNLVLVLQSLRDVGNTVIVVEHDDMIMEKADFIVDIGPGAGELGGEICYAGDYKGLLKSKNSLTGQYLSGKLSIPIPKSRRKFSRKLILEGATANNLKGITVEIPLGVLTVVSGVSGSGKTTLIKDILFPAVQNAIMPGAAKAASYSQLVGNVSDLKSIELVDQSPIGRSARSNPVTYIKAWDFVRDFFSKLPDSKHKSLTPAHFSFNVAGGRCDACQGEGFTTVQMQFMSDVVLTCEACGGKRFRQHVLEVKYKDKNVYDILNMSVDMAVDFFVEETKICSRLKYLQEVGLGYVRLGQSSSTLSGGEAQRIKLAAFLSDNSNSGSTLYIFDEPTTGLHLDDVRKLLLSIQRLVETGNTVILIEHHLEVIKSADWIIDLGPEGGTGGGHLVFAGTPEDLLNCTESYTAKYLKTKL